MLLAEYPTNKKLIKTSWGIINKDRSSYSMRIIDGSEILSMGMDFLTSLRTHFPNMMITRDSSTPKVYFLTRIADPAPAIFEVDGIIYEQIPNFVNPSEIDRIAVIKGNGAIMRYGPTGAGGVIIINTKEQTRIDERGVERSYDNSDLMDSLIDKAAEKKRFIPTFPEYIEAYKNVKSEKKALERYKDHQKRFENHYHYFLDMSNYFKNTWGNQAKGNEILEYVENKFTTDIVALKALAYRYEELGQPENALNAYLKILKARSKEAQSYRDVANAYKATSRFQKALNYYARFEMAMTTLDTLGYDTYGVDFLMTTESDNILRLQGNELELNDESLKTDKLVGQHVRMLFEWNHPDAEFKLQVVSPDEYFDEWQTPADGSIERLKGYYSKQFFFDDDFKGEWQINVDYLGNGTDAPTYIKATVFFDYGQSSQFNQSKVFKLQNGDAGLRLLSVDTEKKYMAP